MNNISREPKYDNDYITKGYLDKQLSDSKDTINNRIENLPKSYSVPPNPPYYKDSLLSYNNKLYRCIRDKLMGVFSLNDWVVIATDDKTIIDFIDKTYSVDKIQLEKQIDGKIESWYQAEDPAEEWTTDILKAKHTGDYWYDITTNNQYRYCKKSTNPITYSWSKVDVPLTIYDQINSKKSIYTSKPTSYKKDDLWIIEADISDDDLPTGEIENPVTKGDWVFAIQDSDVYNKNHWIKRDTDVSIEYIENHYYTKEKIDETFSTQNDVQSNIKKAKDEIELSVEQNYSTKKEITEIVNDYDEKIGTINTTIDNQGELISDLSIENGRISSSVSSINTKMTTIESDVDVLNTIVDTKASAETVEEVINSVNTVQTSVSQNITAIEALKVNDEVQSQKISEFEISVNGITSTVQSQNDKISKITQTTDEINSKISDIADITTSGESQQASVNLVKVNESEPIAIKIHPISEDISYLYPSDYLYPADDLYLMNRIIRFTNTDTNEIFDYELPDDLLYYDANNYDEFILNYDSQTCSIIKRVEYDKATNKNVLKTSEETINYDFPTIALTAGNYTISLPGYSSAYLYVQLMASNIYTTQFATKIEMNSEISQTKSDINLKVNELTKADNKMQGEIDVQSKQIVLKVDNNGKIVKATLTADPKDGTAFTIDADNINLTATDIINLLANNTINLTSGNIVIDSTNFKVDKDGNTTMGNANITGGNINMLSPNNNPKQILTGIAYNGKNSKLEMCCDGFNVYDENSNLIGYLHTGTLNGNSSSSLSFSADNYEISVDPGGIEVVTKSGTSVSSGTYISAKLIETPKLIQTSTASKKKNFEKYSGALDELNRIDIYKYNLKYEKDDTKKHLGFVIGKKYKYSETITNDKNDGVDLYSMASLCLQAIKEQQTIINELKEEIKILKERTDEK